MIFEKAQCVRCHRFGERGESVGPDLTNVSRRFQKKEILESILFPSQVISDQYASRAIVTKDGRTLTGMVSPTGNGSLVDLASQRREGRSVGGSSRINTRSKISAMPDGLLNKLTLEQVADLFAYLNKPPSDELNLSRRPARTAE